MPLTVKRQGDVVTLVIRGDIDHHSAPALRNAADEAISHYRPKLLIFDFSEVTVMDSSGIGLVMGRYRSISAYDGRLELVNLSLRDMKIMKLSGIEKIARIRGGEELAKAAK